jgi:PAS domain S-box-containing protein
MSAAKSGMKRCLLHPKTTVIQVLRSLFIVLALHVFVAAVVCADPPKFIHVVMDDNYPPYVFKDEQGELKGIVVDQWRLWEKKTGIRAELTGMDWGEAQKRMQAGEFDVIDTIFKTEKREVYLEFTRPYAKIDFSIFLHKDISGIRDAKDLRGFLVGAKAGGAVIDILRKSGIENIAVFPRDLSIVEAARDSKIKVFVMGDQSALYFLNKLQIAHDYRHTADLFSAEFHRAVPRGRSDLRNLVENGFAGISPAEFSAIEKEWMGASIGTAVQLRYLWYTVGAVGVAGAVILGWVLLLRRAVKRKTEELSKSEENYRSIITEMQDVYYRSDAEGHLVMISPSGVELLGYESADQMLGMVIRDTFYHDPDDRDAFVSNLKMKGALSGYQVILKRKDGKPLPVATSTHLLFDPDGAFCGVEGVFRDITEQRQAEEALRTGEEKFSRAFSQAPLLMSISDIVTGRYLEVNNRFCQVSGFTSDEVIGRTSIELGWISSEERGGFVAILKQNGRVQDLELSLIAKDGHTVICLYSAEIINVDGTDRLLSIALDITQRKSIEERLRESEERYRVLFNAESDAIVVIDAETLENIDANDSAVEMYGYSRAELLLLRSTELSAEPEETRYCIATGEGNVRIPLRYHRKMDGTVFPVEITARFFEFGGRRVLLAAMRDLSEIQKLQLERDKSQRLESLGLLAGGIAHDFNNILTGIIGNLSLFRTMIDSDHRASGRLDECQKAAMRAGQLTQQLLTFARGGEPVKKNMDVSQLINESVSFTLRGSTVRGELDLAAGLWSVEADEGQLNQVLNNLLINAVQAMPSGGTVTVRAENEATGAGAERFVRISIRDTGSGIPADILPRIFDPYFSTKTAGNGLGLASAYSIVSRHGGSITVSSEMGHGTEFVILLPAATSPVVIEPSGDGARSEVYLSGRVLLMDDEAMIRDVASIMLSEIGCSFDACSDGAEAVAMFRQAHEGNMPYDVVILDLTVPGGMGGLEAARLIKGIDPQATLIVSSGYSQEAVSADFKEYGFSGAVMKPYSMDTFTAEIARVITSRKHIS